MTDLTKILLETLIPLISAIVALIVWLIKLIIRNKKLCEIADIMGGEYGILLSKDKNNNYVVEMKPDFREHLQETYKRFRDLDIDKK